MYELLVLRPFISSYGPRMIDMLEHLLQLLYRTREEKRWCLAGYPDDAPRIFSMADSGFASCKIWFTSHGTFLIFFLGCLINWRCRKHPTVDQNICEAEFVEVYELLKALMFVVQLMMVGLRIDFPVIVLEDNRASVFLSRRRTIQGGRNRHVLVHLSYVLDLVALGLAELKHLGTELMVADIGTKCVEPKVRKLLAPKAMGQVPILGPGLLAALSAPSERLDLPPALDDDGLRERFCPPGEPPRSILFELLKSAAESKGLKGVASSHPSQACHLAAMMREGVSPPSVLLDATTVLRSILPELREGDRDYDQALTAVSQLLEELAYNLEEISLV